MQYDETTYATPRQYEPVDPVSRKNLAKIEPEFREWLETHRSRRKILEAAKDYNERYWLVRAFLRYHSGNHEVLPRDVLKEDALMLHYDEIAESYK